MNAALGREQGVRLSNLLRSALPQTARAGADFAGDPLVLGLTPDSRRIQPGWVFAACGGRSQHGLHYLERALAAGASAVLWEPVEGFDPRPAATLCQQAGKPMVAVAALGKELGAIASGLHGDPTSSLTVVGVTGTDGKTSVSQFLAQALAADGQTCGLIGTLGYGLHGQLTTASHTTPDAARIQQLMAEFRDSGAGYASMEVSSHALDQHRVDGVRFQTAVLTNLGRDHLDYHLTEQAYAAAKQLLFQTQGLGCAVLNLDDGFGRTLRRALGKTVRLLGYSMVSGTKADISSLSLRLRGDGLSLQVVTPQGLVEADVPVIGRFNAQNLLAVIGVLVSMDWDALRISRALAGVQAVPGRMECFGGRDRPLVVVDYAHTAGALAAALQALADHVPGRVLCVFGCGGERDTGKRALMAAAAETSAQLTILTDDNPRGEDPDAIIADIQAGFRRGPARVERDRARAIMAAIDAAECGDAILVAGKGHEDYQITAQGVRHYSDRATVAALVGEVAS